MSGSVVGGTSISGGVPRARKKPWQPALVVLSPKLNERGSYLSHPAAFIRFAMRQPR